MIVSVQPRYRLKGSITIPGDDETSTTLRAAAAEGRQVLDHPLIEPRADELDEIIIGDPLQLDDRDLRDALSPKVTSRP